MCVLGGGGGGGSGVCRLSRADGACGLDRSRSSVAYLRDLASSRAAPLTTRCVVGSDWVVFLVLVAAD